MDNEKYLEEALTLKKFLSFYCAKKHPKKEKERFTYELKHNSKHLRDEELELCDECRELYLYANERLNGCSITPKPKCRSCSDRCYDNKEWKKMAAVMRYSGLRLGYIKIKNIFKPQS